MRRLTRTLTKTSCKAKIAFNTVLGKVYEDVSFPLKQKAVFAQDPNCPADNDPEGKAKYWYYDSNETSLYLKHGSARQSYYLAGDGINEASHNRDAGNKTDNMGYGSSRLTKQLPAVPPNTTTALAPSCNLTLRLQRTAMLL